MRLKLEFEERMKEILGKDYASYCKVLDERYINSIRCNTLKIKPADLKARLEAKGWKMKQLFADYPEIMEIETVLEPGEIGRALEHQLGLYYVQEISSMMPPLALKVGEENVVLDIAAAPGSKTTQMAAMMKNRGVLIANDQNLGRVKILSSNMQRCGVTNLIITQHDGANLCNRLQEQGFQFDKILVDVPCSGEGTIRTSPKTAAMFNENLIKKLSNVQKNLVRGALKVLKVGGEMIYSTCTHAPEENEAVVSWLLENFPVEIVGVKIPLKTRPGMVEWRGEKYHRDVVKCARIYPQDNNTEGFFIAKLRKVK